MIQGCSGGRDSTAEKRMPPHHQVWSLKRHLLIENSLLGEARGSFLWMETSLVDLSHGLPTLWLFQVLLLGLSPR